MMSRDDFGPVFPARYDGTCTICSGQINEGDLIQADDRNNWNRSWSWSHRRCVNRFLDDFSIEIEEA